VDLSFWHWNLWLQPTIRIPQSPIRNVERVFFLGYFEGKSFEIRLGEGKTA
jgi:hypothetical protein